MKLSSRESSRVCSGIR